MSAAQVVSPTLCPLMEVNRPSMLRRGNSRFWTLSGSNALAKNMANELVEIGLFDPKEAEE